MVTHCLYLFYPFSGLSVFPPILSHIPSPPIILLPILPLLPSLSSQITLLPLLPLQQVPYHLLGTSWKQVQTRSIPGKYCLRILLALCMHSVSLVLLAASQLEKPTLGMRLAYGGTCIASDIHSVVQGGREVSDFLDFIKKHATNPPVISGEEEKKKKKKKKKEEL